MPKTLSLHVDIQHNAKTKQEEAQLENLLLLALHHGLHSGILPPESHKKIQALSFWSTPSYDNQPKQRKTARISR